MIKDDGSLNRASCRVFGLAPRTPRHHPTRRINPTNARYYISGKTIA